MPHPGAGGGRLRVEREPGGGEAAGVLAGVVTVGVGERGQGVLAGASGHRDGHPVGQFLQGEQGDPGLQVVGVPDVRVQARGPDAEAPGQLRGGGVLEPYLVGQVGPRLDQAFRGQPRARHTRFLRIVPSRPGNIILLPKPFRQ